MKRLVLAFLFAPFLIVAHPKSFYDRPVRSWDDQDVGEYRKSPKYTAYNASSRIDLRNAWGLSFGGSFTYWKAAQEGLDIAEFRPVNTGIATELIYQKFSFRPGFQAYLLAKPNYDDWDMQLKYTWYRSTTTSRKKASSLELIVSRFADFAADVESISSDWLLHMNLGDAEMGRSLFIGKHLSLRPFISARLAFIKQRLGIDANVFPVVEFDGSSSALVVNSRQSKNYSRAWMLGPRIGCDIDFLLPFGFHLFTNASGTIFYFDYNANFANQTVQNGVIKKGKAQEVYLRANGDVSTGFGWGTSFGRSRFYLDISTMLDMKIFTGQNVMRHLADSTRLGIDGNCGDLYFFGGSAKVRLDF